MGNVAWLYVSGEMKNLDFVSSHQRWCLEGLPSQNHQSNYWEFKLKKKLIINKAPLAGWNWMLAIWTLGKKGNQRVIIFECELDLSSRHSENTYKMCHKCHPRRLQDWPHFCGKMKFIISYICHTRRSISSDYMRELSNRTNQKRNALPQGASLCWSLRAGSEWP